MLRNNSQSVQEMLKIPTMSLRIPEDVKTLSHLPSFSEIDLGLSLDSVPGKFSQGATETTDRTVYRNSEP